MPEEKKNYPKTANKNIKRLRSITKEFYEKKFKQYTEEKEMAVESIRQHGTGQTKYFELGINILELAQRAKEIYLKRSVEEKRQLLGLVFSNLSLKDGNTSSVYHPAFQLIAERVKIGQLLPRQDDYRTINWNKMFENPEVILSQIQQLLHPAL